MFRIEITNRCNLHCVICDRSAMTREVEAIDMDVFKKVLKDAVDFGIPKIGLNRFGEPTLHKNLPEMIAYAKAHGAKHVEFTTNGTLINEKMSRAVLQAGVDLVQFSVDSMVPEVFDRLRAGAKFEVVMQNLETFLRLRKELNSDCKVQLNFVCVKDNFTEVTPFYQYWKDKVDGFNFFPFMGYGDVQDLAPIYTPKKRVKCFMLYYMMVCHVDGKAGVCCTGDPNGILDIGDLTKISVKEAWTGKKAQRIREIHFKGNFEKLGPCKDCDLTFPYTYWLKHELLVRLKTRLGLK